MPAYTYQRIADDLRRAILDGSLRPGDKLPSRHELARRYEVSDRVGVEAVRLLVAEGFAETRSGSGSYVRHRPEMQRLTRAWYTSRRGGSPFRAEMGEAGRAGAWECSSERASMTPAIADRLGGKPGEAAMRTRYTFTADGEPVMLSESWEPLVLTAGTPVMFPEEGPHAGRGVVERMAVIGQQITGAEEVVSARPVLAAEAGRLNIRPGATVLTITRTYRTGERPVETADIVIPVERYALVYEVPVRLRTMRPGPREELPGQPGALRHWCGSGHACMPSLNVLHAGRGQSTSGRGGPPNSLRSRSTWRTSAGSSAGTFPGFTVRTPCWPSRARRPVPVSPRYGPHAGAWPRSGAGTSASRTRSVPSTASRSASRSRPIAGTAAAAPPGVPGATVLIDRAITSAAGS